MTERMQFDDLVDVINRTLQAAGATPFAAKTMAMNFAGCERDGAHSHGVFRVSQVVDTLRTGYLDGTAEPEIELVSPTYLRVDARGGFAQVALARAREDLLAAVHESGVAVVAIRNSHHHSALWPDIEPFARAGFVALTAVTGGVANTAPGGARHSVFGTNPFAYAIPTQGTDPLVADFATSSMSLGDVTLAAQDGRRVPAGTGVDRHGNDTTDPAEILDGGRLLPFGGHKGALLSLMVELLASALTGGDTSIEAEPKKPAGAVTTSTGQFVLVLDPDRGRQSEFAQRAAALIDAVRDAGVDRMPGGRRYAARAVAEAEGIPVTDATRELIASFSNDRH